MTRKKTIGNDAEPSRGCAQYIFHAVFLYRRHTNYDDALHIQTHAGESKKEIAERKDWFRNRRSEWRTTTRKTKKMCVVCVCCTLAIRRIQLDKKNDIKKYGLWFCDVHRTTELMLLWALSLSLSILLLLLLLLPIFFFYRYWHLFLFSRSLNSCPKIWVVVFLGWYIMWPIRLRGETREK